MEKLALFSLITCMAATCLSCTSIWREEEPLTDIAVPAARNTLAYHEGALRKVVILPPAIKQVQGDEIVFKDEYGSRLQQKACAYLHDWKGYECITLEADDIVFPTRKIPDQELTSYLWDAASDETGDLSRMIRHIGEKYSTDGVMMITGVDHKLTDTETYVQIFSAGLVPLVYTDTARIDVRLYRTQGSDLVWSSSYWNYGTLTAHRNSFWRVIKLNVITESLFEDIENAIPSDLVTH